LRSAALSPSASVIVCTRNRADSLALLLQSLAAMERPAQFEWELLVVDNGSTDGTRAVVQAHADRLPLRYLQEARPGLSHARNRGVAEAGGDYVCWTDDDVIVGRNWLASYSEAFLRHPGAVLFGGKIMPLLQSPTPRWLSANLDTPAVRSLMVFRDMGDAMEPICLEGARFPWGANFAVRRAELQRCPFDPELGHAPYQRRVGEESDVIYRLISQGAQGWWVPDCVVHHVLPPSRQRLREVLRHFHAVGETFAYVHQRSPGANWNELTGPPRFSRLDTADLHRARLRLGWRFAKSWLRGDQPRALALLSELGLYGGVAAFRRHQRPHGAKKGIA